MTPENLQINCHLELMADFKSSNIWDWWLHFNSGVTGVLLKQVSKCLLSIKLLANSLYYSPQMIM